MSRRNARRYALQVLYSWEINQFKVSGEMDRPQVLYGLEEDDESILSEDVEGKDLDFARGIIGAVKEHLSELDLCISRHLKKWSISQISLVDKNILRIALAEYKYPEKDQADKAVIFDEAVDLAKEFSTGDSYRFVNGILTAAIEETASEEIPEKESSEEIKSSAPVETVSAEKNNE